MATTLTTLYEFFKSISDIDIIPEEVFKAFKKSSFCEDGENCKDCESCKKMILGEDCKTPCFVFCRLFCNKKIDKTICDYTGLYCFGTEDKMVYFWVNLKKDIYVVREIDSNFQARHAIDLALYFLNTDENIRHLLTNKMEELGLTKEYLKKLSEDNLIRCSYCNVICESECECESESEYDCEDYNKELSLEKNIILPCGHVCKCDKSPCEGECACK